MREIGNIQLTWVLSIIAIFSNGLHIKNHNKHITISDYMKFIDLIVILIINNDITTLKIKYNK